MKKNLVKLAFGLVFVILAQGYAQAKGPSAHRNANFAFTPNVDFLKTGDLEYFYVFIDKATQVPAMDEDSNNQIPVNPLDQILALDSENIYSTSYAKGEFYNIVVSKTAEVLNKPPAFFVQHFPEAHFQETVHPGMTYTPDPSGRGHFTVDGSFRPTERCEIDAYAAANLSRIADPGVRYILNLDAQLGRPSAVLAEHHHDFGTLMGSKTAKLSRTVMKVYPFGSGQSMLVIYTLLYLESSNPWFLGGNGKIRTKALETALEGLKIINDLPNN